MNKLSVCELKQMADGPGMLRILIRDGRICGYMNGESGTIYEDARDDLWVAE